MGETMEGVEEHIYRDHVKKIIERGIFRISFF